MRKILFILLSLITTISFSQKAEFPENLEEIVHFERQNHVKILSFEKTTVGNMYDLKYHRFHWTIDPAVNFISGSVTTYFTASENNLSVITFDLLNVLVVDSIESADANLSFEQTNDVLSVQLSNSLSINQLDSLTIWYHGVPSEGGGFGSFIQSTHNGSPIIWTLSEPYGAKDWWPCKQNLNDKIDSIDIIVETPSPNRVASNGILVSEVTEGSNTIFHWKHRHPIPAYLIAISVTNYAFYSDFAELEDMMQVEVLNYVFPEDLVYAQNNTGNVIPVLEFYSEKFINYPYADEKYGHAQFGWGGGMEHQTMSFMGGFSYGLMAHELAHQWFGDYITCGSWEDIWINEGFATYLTGLSYEEFDPEYWPEYKQNQTSYIISQPGGSVLCDDTTDVSRIFNGRLSYTKGGMVLHMLRQEIGDDFFFTALRNFLNDPELANGYAVTDQLRNHFEAVADTNLVGFFNDWYAGEGFPTYFVTWSQNSNKVLNISVDQTQSHASVDFFEMHLPILLEGSTNDTIIRLHNTVQHQEFNLSLDFEVNELTFDPGFDLVKGESQIVVSNDKLTEEVRFSVYPNPASTSLTIHSFNGEMIEDVEVYDLLGKQYIKERLFSERSSLDLNISDLNPGLYVIRINTKNEYTTQKLSVK